ncbi:LacI family DNA-binding transcriptional regulator [Marinifilum caeruleilacunae]|uniref:LacI family transcriptional regulator n=1 Tax=Marinifilum caeruleilacunae TaxID=2499076 RepID=A0ABX1WZJ0_9BACT|nr:LacI family DNA-binding transcriptional regulator [Marinifilum caeruleilacunae]NOU61321.1 LacI family transcriptional regulator [Marinifilum caeruleilacunae]
MVKSKIRIKDIAEQAGVSVGTVDRVLHNRGEVAEETKKKILDIAKANNYHPNLIARALTSKKQCIFATLMPSPTEEDIFWKRPLSGISDAATELEQFQVKIEKFFFDHYNEQDFIQQTKEILKLRPAGVVFPPIFKQESLDFIQKLEKQNIPYVFLESKIKDCNYLAYVGSDGYHSGRVAANVVDFSTPKNGDILIINLAKNLENIHHLNKRTQGFLSYFMDHGRNTGLKINIEIPTSNTALIKEKLNAVLSKNQNIKAIYITGSKVHKIAEYLIHNNLDEITLVGFDPIEQNIKYLKQGTINYLIGQHPYQQGFKAIKKLFDHVMLHNTISRDEILPVDIINRESIKLYFL